jgi:RNA polymerase sigma factor (sigma-70 family)
MRNSQANPVLRYIRQVTVATIPRDVADRELLESFIRQRDETAFTALIRRHGPMVRRLCLRVLLQEQDAEDAFQATFLVLSRKAAALRPRESLAGWLHCVAYRTAQKARIGIARRRRHEGAAVVIETRAAGDPLAQMTVREAQEILDQELVRLPDKFRVPLVLCYLEGLTRDEAAQRLGWQMSLLKSRLEQARERLEVRLAARGLALAGALVAGLIHEGTASASIPHLLLDATVKAAFAGSGAASLIPLKVAALAEGVVKAMFMTKLKTAALGLIVLGVLSLGVGLQSQRVLAGKPEGEDGPVLERGRGDAVRLPAEMLTKLGIQVAEVKARMAQPRVLQLDGSTSLDPQGIIRVRGPFAPFEVLEIGKPDGQDRELRTGDHVRKGQVLGVVSSADVAEKKDDLFNALMQMKLDEEMFERAQGGAKPAPEGILLTYRRAVTLDQNAIDRALKYLESVKIPDNEIAAVRQSAKEASAKPKPDTEDVRKARLERWAKVELRAESDGLIVERNVSQHEIVLDGAINLFQIAALDRLMVIANVSEEDLPSLRALKPNERRWTVRPVQLQLQIARNAMTETVVDTSVEGIIDEIGALIDPNGHTAVVKGYIDNKNRQLRAGQHVKATVVLAPLPVAEVVLPSSALVEEGRQSFVFIQTDAKKFLYEQRRVLVVRRGKDAVHVRARLTPEEDRQGFQTVRPGEHVVTAGVLELKAILDDLKALHD